ncbi:hypothetical protein BDC45DRAFT_568827 [Circinella umbellata]|nr:hypothetical protein BDC45DRAFT_568827 [Circinella umbellata]
MPTLPSKRRSLRFGKDSTPRTSIKPTGSVPDLQHLSLHSFFKKRHSGSSSHNNNNNNETNKNNNNNNNNNETMKDSQRVNDNNHDLTTSSTNTTPSIIPSEKVDPSQILKGVIACLDIRTEDGDDVSQSFERSLQSMGAKTRRTFSDSITHLIYKNGSTATLRKALGKKVVIVNLLWITRCKTEGKRLNEKEFLIDRPQGIIMSAKKRRKSMEPGKVKALEMDASEKRELLLDNESKRKRQRSDNVSEPRTRRLSEKRNHMHHSALMDSSTWKAEDIPSTSSSSSSRNSHTDEEDEILGDKKSSLLHDVDDHMSMTTNGDDDDNNKSNDKQQPIRRRLSLIPSTSTTTTTATIANNKRRESALFTPEMRERSNQIKAQIKADFFIQDADSSSSASSSPKPSSSRLSLGSSSNTPPLKRKRRSMGPNNIHKAPITSSISTTPTPTITFNNNSNVISTIASSSSSPSASTPTPMKSVSLRQKPITKTKKMIVMTGMTQQLRDTCTKIIRKLGIYEIGTFVDSRTTHVIVGSKRRTESVLSGMALKLWLVTPDWLLKSGEAEQYLEETKYEATKFFSRVTISRTSNKQLLPSNIHICIHSVHALTKESMEQLVLRANGKIVHSLREADIVISKTPLDTDKVVVNENWLFYCIEQWKYLPFDKFTLKK